MGERPPRVAWLDSVELTAVENATWLQVGDSGLLSALSFFSQPGSLGRRSIALEDRQVTEIEEQPDGTNKRSSRPYEVEDWQVIHDQADSFLREATLPSRPFGWQWYIRNDSPWPGALVPAAQRLDTRFRELKTDDASDFSILAAEEFDLSGLE